ncbi:MAG: polysaccharide biosynthesis tyrosine autokinase [Acidimicrobiia bacterium]
MAPADQEVAEVEVRDYLRILRHRAGIVAATAAAVVALAMVWVALQDPSYRARARVLIRPDSSQSVFGNNARVADPNRFVQTEILVFESPAVRDLVRDRIGPVSAVRTRQVEQTDVIEVEATEADPQRAARVANAYAEAYIELRRTQAVDNVVAAVEQLQTKISELQREIDTTGGDRQRLLIDQQAAFRQKLDELQVDSSLQQSTARLVAAATAPGRAAAPAPVRTGVTALVFGAMLGIGLALAREYLDDSVRSADDLAGIDVPVLASIPVVPTWRTETEALVVSLDAPTSRPAEMFRTLRTSLEFLAMEHDISVVQVTSPGEGEGKSATVANLAVALARAGRRVVMVDCDLRRPRLHRYFETANDVGLTSVMAGAATLTNAVVPVPGLSRVLLLPAGPVPGNPSELLGGTRTGKLIDSLRGERAIVLVDSPPALPVADALLISRHVDATLVVCRAGRSTRRQVRRTIELITGVKGNIAGLVVNGVPEAAIEGRYGYSYREEGPGRRQASGGF